MGKNSNQFLIRSQTLCTTRGDLHHIDPTIANTVSQLDGIVRKKRRLEEDAKLAPGERQERIKNLTMDGCPIEDLGLDFTLPGYPNIELRKGGKIKLPIIQGRFQGDSNI